MIPHVQSEHRDSSLMEYCAQAMVDLGVPDRVARPPIYRGLWKIGVPVRPPLYSEPVSSIIISGLILGSLWGGIMRLISWESMTPSGVLVSLGFGLINALFFRWLLNRQRRRYSLPSWETVTEHARSNKEGEQPGPAQPASGLGLSRHSFLARLCRLGRVLLHATRSKSA